jgi:hypothetical protein
MFDQTKHIIVSQNETSWSPSTMKVFTSVAGFIDEIGIIDPKFYSSPDLIRRVNTFFREAMNGEAAWVLEIGPGTPADGVEYVKRYIDEHDEGILFHAWLFPASWNTYLDQTRT